MPDVSITDDSQFIPWADRMLRGKRRKKYVIRFKIPDFDREGEEHRLSGQFCSDEEALTAVKAFSLRINPEPKLPTDLDVKVEVLAIYTSRK